MSVTLVLTRFPTKSFKLGNRSGRWGELVAIRGPKVSAVQMAPNLGGCPTEDSGGGGDCIAFGGGTLNVSTVDGSPIEAWKRFTSLERFKADGGAKGFYVQLHPKPGPYFVTYEAGNSVVKTLRPDHDGRCLRVHGGSTSAEQGILIHEAPEVGWLIGCISPRPLNNLTTQFPNKKGNPSYRSMNELFQFVGANRADLFVTDW
jgi:hypothetical protein